MLAASLQMLNPAQRINLLQVKLVSITRQMHQETNKLFALKAAEVKGLIERFEQSGPMQTLKRGYTIALDASDRPLTSVLDVQEVVHLQFHDGRAKLKTISTVQETRS